MSHGTELASKAVDAAVCLWLSTDDQAVRDTASYAYSV